MPVNHYRNVRLGLGRGVYQRSSIGGLYADLICNSVSGVRQLSRRRYRVPARPGYPDPVVPLVFYLFRAHALYSFLVLQEGLFWIMGAKVAAFFPSVPVGVGQHSG